MIQSHYISFGVIRQTQIKKQRNDCMGTPVTQFDVIT